MNKIVAVVGMCGSGKSIASEYLEKIGFQKIYFGGVTMEVLKEKNLEVTPQNEKQIRESLRKEYGMGAYAKLLLPKIDSFITNGNVVLDGLYSWEELKILKEKYQNNLVVLAILVDKTTRYARLKERNIRPLDEKQAEDRDCSEIENLEKGGPIAFADYYILNNDNVEKYEEELKKFTSKILEED